MTIQAIPVKRCEFDPTCVLAGNQQITWGGRVIDVCRHHARFGEGRIPRAAQGEDKTRAIKSGPLLTCKLCGKFYDIGTAGLCRRCTGSYNREQAWRIRKGWEQITLAEWLKVKQRSRDTRLASGDAPRSRKPGSGFATGAKQRAKTHCPKGHLYDEANTGYLPQGWRYCRQCHRERTIMRYHLKSNAPPPKKNQRFYL
jgi:hypothetical protein